MRQVNRDELVYLLYDGLRTVTPAVRAMLNDRRTEVADRGRFLAAQQLAEKFKRLELLSDAPEPPPFRFADHQGGSGVPGVEE